MIIRFMITKDCNNNCSYCFVTNSTGYEDCTFTLNKNIVEEQLINLKERGIMEGIELIGGEPFYDPSAIDWLMQLNKNRLGKLPIVIFTSASINVDETIAIFDNYKNEIPISVIVSYDGYLSNRNRANSQYVKNAIFSMKQHEISVGIRWSINRDDINNILVHFKELLDMKPDNIIFFPMKNADYTPEDTSLFVDQFQKVIKLANENQIDFLGMDSFRLGCKITISNKANFSCNNNLTILPNGQFCICYVAYFSNGMPEDMLFNSIDETLESAKTPWMESPDHCNDCYLCFICCNKCYGNLREYQRLTGNEFFDSYCNLMKTLSQIYIKYLLTEVNTTNSIVVKQGSKEFLFQNLNGEVWRLEPSEIL